MKTTDVNKLMSAAHARYEKAAKALSATTAKCYPIGRTVSVTLGRARVVGRIISAGHWCEPFDTVEIENIVTGKRRHFSGADSHNFHKPQLLGE
jgi:hypothetical protein